MSLKRLFNRWCCLIAWVVFSVLFFFCNFGHTDAEGFHHGWLFVTRPGWLFFTLCVYVNVVLIGLGLALVVPQVMQGHKMKANVRKIILLAAVWVLIMVLTIWAGSCWGRYVVYGPSSKVSRSMCIVNLRELGVAMQIYAYDYDGYPTSDKWCDLLHEHQNIRYRQFKCSAAKNGRCSYAFNPNAEPNSPNDVVLLFETKGGWNQYGGPELLSTENHRGEGCSILFNDGHVEFVQAERLGELKWDVEENENTGAEEKP